MAEIAALFVEPGGPYWDLPGVDPWGPDRDARRFDGSKPGVYHPPCKRWGRYWHGGPSAKVRYKLGDDDGCFASALENVELGAGIIEHPEASHAWKRFEIAAPPRSGGWVRAGLFRPGWTCCVYQGHYGHRAAKATWLYAVGVDLPDLIWGDSGGIRLDAGYHSAEERAAASVEDRKERDSGRLTDKERIETPKPFRDVLIAMARTAL